MRHDMGCDGSFDPCWCIGRGSRSAAAAGSLPAVLRAQAAGSCRRALARARCGGGRRALGPVLPGHSKAGGRRLVAFVFSAPRRQRGRTEEERSIAHARPMAVDVRADWDDEEDLGPSLASGNGRRGLVAVGPGPTEVDEEWEPAEEVAALGSRMRPGDAPLRVRVITTGVDGRTTILDDEAPTVSCPRCGYRHSAAASYCRRCGYSQSNRPTTRWQGTSADDKAVARRGQR